MWVHSLDLYPRLGQAIHSTIKEFLKSHAGEDGKAPFQLSLKPMSWECKQQRGGKAKLIGSKIEIVLEKRGTSPGGDPT
jgi:hypothetical protein